jgi:tetratricopeptide (TPR) repeat protein
VLALSRKALGPEHPDTLMAMHNLANYYGESGRWDEALKLREEVLPLCRKVNGPGHPGTLRAMHNLASSYQYASRLDEALKLREEALVLGRKVLGPEHPDTLTVMNDVAFSYDAAGRRDEALKLREEVLALRRKALGPEHPDTLGAMNNLGISYAEAGRRDEALELREKVLALRRKVNGPEQPDTLRAIQNLVESYDGAGRRDQALRLREEALPLSRKLLGPQHPYTIGVMQGLGHSYLSLGRNQEAFALVEKACELDPRNTDASLTLATWQTWFGHDADYEATRRRLVQQAEGTGQASTAERAAKAFCLRPSTDAALLAKALKLAQQAVELGKNEPALPWYQLGLGLAEYRNGQYAAAERALTLAEQTAVEAPDLQGTAHLFRAMSLFRQDRPEEARRLFSEAEAQMPPLPKDEGKPLVDGRALSHDLLIRWLAYKEARTVLNEPAAARP